MALDCQTCGACCQGLTVDVERTDEDVPPKMVKDDRLFGMVMRERNGHCIALSGKIGEKVRCRIYEGRPQVCRDFRPGNEFCLDARRRAGLPLVGTFSSGD